MINLIVAISRTLINSSPLSEKPTKSSNSLIAE